jgi:hypothetical protein
VLNAVPPENTTTCGAAAGPPPGSPSVDAVMSGPVCAGGAAVASLPARGGARGVFGLELSAVRGLACCASAAAWVPVPLVLRASGALVAPAYALRCLALD